MVELGYNKHIAPQRLRSITLNANTYKQFFILFKKAMGGFYESDYYVVKLDQVMLFYKSIGGINEYSI